MKKKIKRLLSVLALMICVSLVMSACVIKEAAERITTVEEQTNAINSSIVDLKKTDSELKTYIDTLKSTVTTLEGEVNDIDKRVEQLEQANNNLGSSLTGILQDLNELKDSVTSEIASIYQTMDMLEEQRLELDAKISDLENLTDTLASKDWTEATFATLEQYETVQADLSEIKVDITWINGDISNLELSINSQIESIKERMDTFVTPGELKNEIIDITAAYTIL